MGLFTQLRIYLIYIIVLKVSAHPIHRSYLPRNIVHQKLEAGRGSSLDEIEYQPLRRDLSGVQKHKYDLNFIQTDRNGEGNQEVLIPIDDNIYERSKPIKYYHYPVSMTAIAKSAAFAAAAAAQLEQNTGEHSSEVPVAIGGGIESEQNHGISSMPSSSPPPTNNLRNYKNGNEAIVGYGGDDGDTNDNNDVDKQEILDGNDYGFNDWKFSPNLESSLNKNKMPWDTTHQPYQTHHPHQLQHQPYQQQNFQPSTNENEQKRNAYHAYKRQKSVRQQTQFIPSISVGAMSNMGNFFDNLKNNIDVLENKGLSYDQIRFLEGDHPMKSLRHELSSENLVSKPTGTAAFLHAIRTYRPSQRVRALVATNPDGYHGSNFLDPNYMWLGLGKK